MIEVILSSSGFDISKTLILSNYGITVPQNLRPLVAVIKAVNSPATIIVHRDRDFLIPTEVAQWETAIRAIGAEPFVTRGRDIEAYCINAVFLAEHNQMDVQAFDDLINAILAQKQADLLSSYVNGRIDIIRKQGKVSTLDHGALAVEAQTIVSQDPKRCAGKAILSTFRGKFKELTQQNLIVQAESTHLLDTTLEAIATRIFRSVPRTGGQTVSTLRKRIKKNS